MPYACRAMMGARVCKDTRGCHQRWKTAHHKNKMVCVSFIEASNYLRHPGIHTGNLVE